MMPIKDLCLKYNFDYNRLLRWIKRGYVKAEKRNVRILHKGYRQRTSVSQDVDMWFVDEDSFLSIPAFVRRNKKEKPKTLEYLKKVGWRLE
ncbi:MAG: hypothetical protein N2505_06155 [Endomicrobia bacterium]|nr:hypothetical protein [Endomicrobiia bacterium]